MGIMLTLIQIHQHKSQMHISFSQITNLGVYIILHDSSGSMWSPMTHYTADASGGFGREKKRLYAVLVYTVYPIQPCINKWTNDALLYTQSHPCLVIYEVIVSKTKKIVTAFTMEGLFACKRLQKVDQFNLLWEWVQLQTGDIPLDHQWATPKLF
jgi:hypothetical protein